MAMEPCASRPAGTPARATINAAKGRNIEDPLLASLQYAGGDATTLRSERHAGEGGFGELARVRARCSRTRRPRVRMKLRATAPAVLGRAPHNPHDARQLSGVSNPASAA